MRVRASDTTVVCVLAFLVAAACSSTRNSKTEPTTVAPSSSTTSSTTILLPGLYSGPNPGSGRGAVAVPLPDGSVLYDSIENEQQPVIRRLVRGGTTGELFIADAFSPVVSRDGTTLSYTKVVGALDSGDRAKTTALVIRRGLNGPDTTVAEGPYIFQSLFFGRGSLVAQREYVGGPINTDTVLVTPDGQAQILNGFPLAMSPDGRRVVVSTNRLDALLTMFDTATGAAVAEMSLRDYLAFLPPDVKATVATDHLPDTSQGETLPWTFGDGLGVWTTTALVLPGSPGPFVFRATDSALSAVAVIKLPTPAGFADYIAAINPLSDGSDAIAAWVARADLAAFGGSGSSNVSFRCSIAALACTQDDSLKTTFSPVQQLSR